MQVERVGHNTFDRSEIGLLKKVVIGRVSEVVESVTSCFQGGGVVAKTTMQRDNSNRQNFCS